jgi:WD40 repeat protein
LQTISRIKRYPLKIVTMIQKDKIFTVVCCVVATMSFARAVEVPRCASQGGCKDAIRYDGLGSVPGNKVALPFGAEILPLPESAERVVAFHPDGKELFFTRLAAPIPQIMRSIFRDGKWQAPEPAPFSDLGVNVEPSISPDGRSLYFVSTRPPSRGTDIWKVDRTDSGWSQPVRLSDVINTAGNEWHPQVIANGDLYFAADDRSDSRGDADLYVSKFEHGEYHPAQNLGPNINTAAADWDGYVDPRGKYLIFKSNRPGGFGGLDMYISRFEQGAWGPAKNLGPAINTAADEDSGDVTPDGRFLIFARRASSAAPWALYWLDAKVLAIN